MRGSRLIQIKSDVFDIADRIREIDERYRLYYNSCEDRFEIRLKGREAELVVTWKDALDARLVTKLRETHVRRVERFIEELEAQENKARIEEAKAIKEKAGESAEAFMSVAWRSRG